MIQNPSGEMNEDERYRSSTQYRLWSYTPSSLAQLRTATNELASQRVKAAVERARASRAASVSGSGDASEAEQNGVSVVTYPEGEIDCLDMEEELKVVKFYCRQTLQLGDHLKFPTDVKVSVSSLGSESEVQGSNIGCRQQLYNISSVSTSPTQL